MDNITILTYLNKYGPIFIFLIVFWEHLNLPGMPSSVIMPIIGIWLANSAINFFLILAISIISGTIASCILYFIGFYGGVYLIEKYMNAFPKQKKYINSKLEYLRIKGNIGIFICRLIPMARTISPIPAGILRFKFSKYLLYSTLGITLWNSALISSGYILGYEALKLLS